MDTRHTAADQPLTDAVISAAVDNAIREARQQDTAPRAVIGDAPPVEQPGRPSMSQRATDISGVMIAAGISSLPIGGMTALVIRTLGNADPAALAIGACAPAALALPILAFSSLVKRAKHAAPDVHHHHYNAPVDQRTVNTDARGVWAKNQVRGVR